MENKISKKRSIKGTVVSDKMDKTVTVVVNKYVKDPKYKKFYKTSKKYKAHDEKNQFHVGDVVYIEESKPISKDKHFIAVSNKESKA
ncbi:30S ribosomal protein S17 [Candidatus Campbellbacteria bacterium CG22_combo_CG10-13_8_21_14_all_36_13]|uniref:Small ribosomal subunit protein uS17 n=1 Tax=Candidatus Campbellbacteria bacterium CG22_combo_CG10-13_8_21_14_all_36_13 TaxID=1974529 RepID=A0A2H0DY83_9BACT|nr:MAG: 30S ribosomal protein S17 [Candidatus Campbellbacteria bacterium CG22_combo_CG10-13_8_21_14_all_36_13]